VTDGRSAAERALIDLLKRLFADKTFDEETIKHTARDNPELAAAIERLIPDCRWKSQRSRRRPNGGFRPLRVDRVLRRLAAEHFDIDFWGWWRVKGTDNGQNHNKHDSDCG